MKVRVIVTYKGDFNSKSFFAHGEPAASETSCLIWNTVNPNHSPGEDEDDEILGTTALMFNEDVDTSGVQTTKLQSSTTPSAPRND